MQFQPVGSDSSMLVAVAYPVNPLVSILIPAYNAEEWIVATLESALAQTWPRKEIIVVDDGSRDSTVSVAQRFASNEVKVISQKNQGAAAARNTAFSHCRGDYVQWLDADDLLAPDKIAKQVRAMGSAQGKRTLLSSAWGRFFYRSAHARFSPSSLWCDLSPTEWLLRKLEHNAFMQTGTWLVSRELTEAAGPWDTRLLGDDDGEYFCRVLLASDGVRFVPEAKLFYRIVGSNRLSHIGRSAKRMDAHLVSMKLHIGYLRKLEDSERVRSACLKYLQRWLIYFYPERPDIVEQVKKLASDVGGELKTPRLPWKYAWIQKAFGWSLAKRAWLGLPMLKSSWVRSWDRILYRLERK